MKSEKNRLIALERIADARLNKSFFLDLSSLNLEELPDDISDLNHLIEIDLSYNFLSEMPKSISSLLNLKILNLSNNYISTINFTNGIHYLLKKLDISNNLLYEIPDSLEVLMNCDEIIFKNNPFLNAIPQSLRSYDIWYILEYLNLTKYKETQRHYETKLIFVGRGEVGKTTLIKVLKDNSVTITPGAEETTHGINIDHIDIDVFFPARPPHYNHYFELQDLYQTFTYEEVNEYEIDYDYHFGDNYLARFYETFLEMDEDEKVGFITTTDLGKQYKIKKEIKTNLWDFGGQEIYHSTHQFFLTKRSIYIFVWEPRKDGVEEEFEYWLNIIKLLGQNSPVIVVMNKSEVRHYPIDKKGYNSTFPNIAAFLEVSCIKKSGIRNLKFQISNCIANLPHLGDELPKSWIQIRDKLNKIEKDYINISEFKNLCSNYITDFNNRHLEHISDYLHDVGDIIHFKNSPLLKNILIINPQWATKAVYSLIDTIPIQKKNGVFEYDDMEKYLNLEKYPVETHIQLLELMEKFEICFKAVGSPSIYIIPELLSNEIPNIKIVEKIKESKDIFKFRFTFNFMPKGILSRLICKLFYLLNSENYWKNGVIFKYDSSIALIISDKLDKKLDIYITGQNKRDLYGLIKNELIQIFSIFNMIESKDFYEEIPCNCDVCSIDQEPHYFRNSTLKIFIDKSKNSIDCLKSAISVNISDLLFLYRNSNPNKSIIYNILSALSRLQGLSRSIETSEDSRNSYISDALSQSGIISKDQSRWGISSSGHSIGEPDIIFEETTGKFLTFYEGINLQYLNKTTIISHIEKIINKYDALGVAEKFLGCYCKTANFSNLSNSYYEFLQTFTHESIKFTDVQDITSEFTNYTELKIFKTYYYKSERKISLTHILINLQ
ncbi:hypothetical protein EGI15_03365 [Chryseobacterium cucumeris]|uniref:non-specific serine/threonine protein kinase n=1 Tax=Chryseobacterium cucumeris TaxID=1813611 RepID=A0ABX9XBZ5_9FLAO|nr:COR domain-containing protein [Chryseobacterium cucumeris]ROH94907.1 hypothetical protein EGI15_03365 [Chryseobacterium cucumeris]